MAQLAAQVTARHYVSSIAGETSPPVRRRSQARPPCLPIARRPAVAHLTEETIFQKLRSATRLGSELYVVARNESYRILRQGEGAPERLYAQVRPNLVVAMAERKAFDEAVWQLTRPLKAANVRVLALEPGGPPRLASTPRIDPATKRALVDVIDPASLPAAPGTARPDPAGDGGVEGRAPYAALERPRRAVAARPSGDEEADVIRGAARRHHAAPPGGRNWLWQGEAGDQAMHALATS
jgi:hypothetical protein